MRVAAIESTLRFGKARPRHLRIWSVESARVHQLEQCLGLSMSGGLHHLGFGPGGDGCTGG